MFYDSTKSAEENKKEHDKTKQNTQALYFITAGVALVTAVMACTLQGKKIVDEFL